jgi:hypothetical protein
MMFCLVVYFVTTSESKCHRFFVTKVPACFVDLFLLDANNVVLCLGSYFYWSESRDWERLQMVLLDRSAVRMIPLQVYF